MKELSENLFEASKKITNILIKKSDSYEDIMNILCNSILMVSAYLDVQHNGKLNLKKITTDIFDGLNTDEVNEFYDNTLKEYRKNIESNICK